jgi:hypothetical protein
VLRIRDVYLRFRILIFSILDPGSKNRKKRERKNGCLIVFVAITFTILEIILVLNKIKKKKTETMDKEFKYFYPKKQLLRSQNMG